MITNDSAFLKYFWCFWASIAQLFEEFPRYSPDGTGWDKIVYSKMAAAAQKLGQKLVGTVPKVTAC